MTLEELDRHAELRRRLDRDKELLASLYSAIDLGAQTITGMPHPSGYRDKLGELIPEIAAVKDDIADLAMQIRAEEKEVIAFIETITDVYTGTLFKLRFLRGLTWKEVAAVVRGGNTEESVRSACYRYLRKLHRRDDR